MMFKMYLTKVHSFSGKSFNMKLHSDYLKKKKNNKARHINAYTPHTPLVCALFPPLTVCDYSGVLWLTQ